MGLVTDQEVSEAIELATKQIHKRFGASSLFVPGQDKAVLTKDVLPFGVSSFDVILGGGIEKGSLVEIFGPESAGKTTITLQLVAQAQRHGMKVLFLDQEHALDPEYAEALGVDAAQLFMAQPSSGEECLSILEALVDTGEIGLVVVDSLASMATEAEIEKEPGEMTMGQQAKLMSTWLRKYISRISQTNTIVIFTNQLRENVGGYGKFETTPGGRAIKFFSKYRIDVRIEDSIESDGVRVGNKLKLTTVKNKTARPFQRCNVDLIFGEGLDSVGSTLDTAYNLGILKKGGAWYTFHPDMFPDLESVKIQGRANTKAYLKENQAILTELETYVRDALCQ